MTHSTNNSRACIYKIKTIFGYNGLANIHYKFAPSYFIEWIVMMAQEIDPRTNG